MKYLKSFRENFEYRPKMEKGRFSVLYLSRRCWSKAKSSPAMPLARRFSKLLPSCLNMRSFCSSGCDSRSSLQCRRILASECI